MHQRISGRPSGTDGSDFSYRMVVDSRYTKVAKGKSRLYALLLTQVVIQLVGLLYIILSTSEMQGSNMLAISSSVFGFISLLIGELGRRWSRASFLMVYIIASSIPILLSLFYAIHSNSTLQVIQNLSDWETKKFAAIEIFLILLASLVQIYTIITVIFLIGNMSPPKKAS